MSTSTDRPPPLGPPRVVALSGLIFATLYVISLVLVRLAVPADPTEPGAWLADAALRSGVRRALNLIPFTGIAFLWFMAVLRNRLGGREDRFFATVFLGSGLLFVALLFVAVAVSQGLLATFAAAGRLPAQSETYAVGRTISHVLMHSFAVKMAGVFIIVTSTIGLRTALFPRWMAVAGYVLALVMLLTMTDFAWIALVFPFWVFLLSAYFLVIDFWLVEPAPTSRQEE